MSFDYYASLAENKACPKRVNESGLASGFGDGCAVWSCRDGEKNNARQCYMKRAAELEINLPPDLHLEPDHVSLPDSTWFGIDVSFTLVSPWYSKDDRPFHVLDNPVRKDRVFGAPFMSAASWKGLLRWACRMQAGLSDHLEKHDMKMDGWEDPSWIVHLFGNEKGEDKGFRSGTLACYSTWFSKIGFEVINPHSRSRRAGTQPIYYEVVPAGTTGRLQLLYAPLPGEIERDKITPADFIDCFIDSIRALLETYGISAKRTAGWGTTKINGCSLFVASDSWLKEEAHSKEKSEFIPPDDVFKRLMDEHGYPLDILRDEKGELISKTKLKKLGDEKPCINAEFENFSKWYKDHGERYRMDLSPRAEQQTSLAKEAKFDTLDDLRKIGQAWKHARKGGDQ